MSQSAVQENIRFEAGSVGPTVGRVNIEALAGKYTWLLLSAMIYSLYDPALGSLIDRPCISSGQKW